MQKNNLPITTEYLSGITKQASSFRNVTPSDYYMIKAATYEAGMTKSAFALLARLGGFIASKVAPRVAGAISRGVTNIIPKVKGVFQHPGRTLWKAVKGIGGVVLPWAAFEGASRLFGGGSDEEQQDPSNYGPSNNGYNYGPSNNGYNYGPSNNGYNYGPSNNGYNYRPESTSPVLWDRIEDSQAFTDYPASSQPTGSPAVRQNQNQVMGFQDWRDTRSNRIAMDRWQAQQYLAYLNGLSPQQQAQSQAAVAQNQPKPQTQAPVAKPMMASSAAASTRPSGNVFGLDMNDPFSYRNPYSEPVKLQLEPRYSLDPLAWSNPMQSSTPSIVSSEIRKSRP